MINKVLKEIMSKRDKNKAKILSRFFKTGKRQYGEGDIFLGLTVPISRKIAQKYKDISKVEIALLLKNKIHEVRLIAILVLVYKYKIGSEEEKKEIVDFYLKNIKYINNWDLVDLSAHYIIGDYLLKKNKKDILLKLVHSKNLWEQRIAIISTFAFIKKGDIKWTFKIAKMYLDNKHDLIHKATGWMLREAGKKNYIELCKFLDINLHKIPRTMLRYSIEKFPEHIRKEYLKR
ncbi:MAG: DNA alkylation repair protein [Candidatus Paceibacterota bacterium]